MGYRKFKESATVATTGSVKKSTYSNYQIFMKILLSISVPDFSIFFASREMRNQIIFLENYVSNLDKTCVNGKNRY